MFVLLTSSIPITSQEHMWEWYTSHQHPRFNDLINLAQDRDYRTIRQSIGPYDRNWDITKLSGNKCFSIYGLGPTCNHKLGHFISRSWTLLPTLSPTHSFATPPSLYSQEQGWTLELERERIRREIEKGEEGEGSIKTFPWISSTSSTYSWWAKEEYLSFWGFSPNA